MTEARKRANEKYRNKNRELVNKRCREYRHKNRKKIRIRDRWRKLKARHGITKQQYEELFNKQHGRCAICGHKLKKNLAVDHDHKTKMIRGLLCHKCNMALGIFEGKFDSVKKYLNKRTNIKWIGRLRTK